MSGRSLVGFDGAYAISEIGFWLTDPRIQSARATVKVFYHYAWMIAVKDRREVLQAYWTPRLIGKAGGLDPKTSAIAYAWLLENSLLGQTADGRIIVCGIKNKHKNLKWKDDPIPAEIDSQEEEEVEVEVEVEAGELATSLPFASKSDPKKGNGQDGLELRAVTDLWNHRFPEHKPKNFSEYVMIWKGCERLAISPRKLIERIPKDHPTPWRFMHGFLNDTYAPPEPENHGQTFVGWQKGLAEDSDNC